MWNDRIGVPALREAAVPESIPGAVVREPLVEASRAEILLRIPSIGRFLVVAEGPVLVERAPGASDLDVRCFADEAVAAAAALLRGDLVLRAASVAVNGAAVILCGSSAVGKSALAAALAQRGHAVLADAVTVVSEGAVGGLIPPTAPEPVLWPDTADELGLTTDGGRVVRPGLTKAAYRLGPAPAPSPAAVVAFLAVDPAASESRLEPFGGAAKLEALAAASWHVRLVYGLGLAPSQFPAVARLAATTRCFHLIRPSSGATPGALAELVEGLAT